MARWAAAALLLALSVAHAAGKAEEHVVTLDGDAAFTKAVKESEFLVAGANHAPSSCMQACADPSV